MRVTTSSSISSRGIVGKLLFTAFGLFFAFIGTEFVKQEWKNLQETKAMQQWAQTSCTIVSSAMKDDGEDFRLEVSYRYEVDEKIFTSTRYGKHPHYTAETIGEIDHVRKKLSPGKTFDCHYNPANPAEALLDLPTMKGARSSIGFTLLFPAIGLLFATLPWLRGRKQKKGESSKPSGKRFLIIFGAVFALFGLIALKPILITPLQKTNDAKTWNAVSATVVSSKVKSHSDDDGTTYSPYIAYRYEVAGEEYLGDQYTFMGGSSSGRDSKTEIVREYPKGHTFNVYVNPNDPTESVIKRSASKSLLFGLIPLIFVFVGIAIIIAGFRAKKAKLDQGQAHEHVVTLKGSTPLGNVIVSLLFVAIWGGFTFMVFKSESPLLLRIVFGGVEIAMIGAVIHACLALFNPRPTVEITPGAIRPGTSVALRWRINGRADRIGKLTLSLQCLRVTTETSGSGKNRSTRIVKTPIFKEELLQTDSQNEIAQGTLQFRIPEERSCTLPGNDGGIRWQLVFHGDIPRWPDLKQELPFTVYPAS